MSVVRVGSTKKFSDNWQNIFAGATGKKVVKKAAVKKATAKTPAKKKAAKKSAKAKAPRTPAVVPNSPNGKPDRQKKAAAAGSQSPGDAKTKKSAAKRTAKTRKRRAAPELLQKELF